MKNTNIVAIPTQSEDIIATTFENGRAIVIPFPDVHRTMPQKKVIVLFRMNASPAGRAKVTKRAA